MSETAIPASDTSDARAPGGRFAAGNAGGPGNPFNRRVAHLKRLCLAVVSDDKLEALVNVILDKGLAGDMAAAKLILQYSLGKPTAGVEPDRVEIDEVRIRHESALPPDEWMIPFAQVPAELANRITGDMRSQMPELAVEVIERSIRSSPSYRKACRREERAQRRAERAERKRSANGDNGSAPAKRRDAASIRVIDPDDRARAR